MPNVVKITNKIGSFTKTIIVPGDKSLSIRWVLFSSLAKGISKAKNLLMSEDVLAAIDAVKNHGFSKGLMLSTKRVCRCHPWSVGGVDEVPKE